MFKKIFFSVLISLSTFSVASQEQSNSITHFFSGSDAQYCLASEYSAIAECPNGQLMFFAPSSWGNERFPLAVIAEYCDLTKPYVFNNSGVICTKVPSRKEYDVIREKQKAEWLTFKREIQKSDSGWWQFNETGWAKIVKKGTEALPSIPFKMSYEFQSFNKEGKPIGKPQKYVEEINDKTETFFRDQPVGTEIEVAWFPENLLDSSRGKYSIVKAEPIQVQPQKTEKAQHTEEPIKGDETRKKTPKPKAQHHFQF